MRIYVCGHVILVQAVPRDWVHGGSGGMGECGSVGMWECGSVGVWECFIP